LPAPEQQQATIAEESMSTWPQPLETVTGPFPAARLDGAAEGMGPYGPATRAIAAAGQVPPDIVTGMTLFLLAKQPRGESGNRTNKNEGGGTDGVAEGSASPIAGGVWVRERFTVHRPLDRQDPFTVRGENTGRHVHKGRRYGTNTSTTVDSAGQLVATNVTTGLLAYEVVEGLADGVEGVPVSDTPIPGPDHEAAAANPHLDALKSATAGTTLGGDRVVVSLAMMAARDTSSPDNPIHSDLEAAKAAGLERPIAGGSHVLAFALEPILAEFGLEALFHGTHIDARWKAPTKADETIVPTATVTSSTDQLVSLELTVTLDDGSVAMVGTVEIPLPSSAASTHDE
jgi:acyl dehydratase